MRTEKRIHTKNADRPAQYRIAKQASLVMFERRLLKLRFTHAPRLFSHPATLQYCPLHAQLSPARIVKCTSSPCAVSEQWHDSQGAKRARMCMRRDLSNQQASSACVCAGSGLLPTRRLQQSGRKFAVSKISEKQIRMRSGARLPAGCSGRPRHTLLLLPLVS